VLVALSVALDRVTKIFAEQSLVFSIPQDFIGEYVRLVLWYNKGAAFGFSFGGKWVHIGLTLVAMGVVVYLILRTPKDHRAILCGFALILGGAVGNLWDRLANGQVTDFIDVGIGNLRWPTFNIADSSVVVGVSLILLASYLAERAEKRQIADAPSQPSAVAEDGA
jgi:signal peptidase II